MKEPQDIPQELDADICVDSSGTRERYQGGCCDGGCGQANNIEILCAVGKDDQCNADVCARSEPDCIAQALGFANARELIEKAVDSPDEDDSVDDELGAACTPER